MNEILANIRELAAIIRDVGLIIAVPTSLAVGWKLYKQLVDTLKAENDFLRLTQYDQALKQIKAQKELFQLERERLEREMAELKERGAEKEVALEIAKKSLTRVQHKLQLLEEERREVADRIRETSAQAKRDTSGSALEAEALRKLRVWCSSDSYGSPGTIIPDYMFSSSTYGEVAVSQIEQQIMIRRGWIEEIDNGVRISDEGRQAALVR